MVYKIFFVINLALYLLNPSLSAQYRSIQGNDTVAWNVAYKASTMEGSYLFTSRFYLEGADTLINGNNYRKVKHTIIAGESLSVSYIPANYIGYIREDLQNGKVWYFDNTDQYNNDYLREKLITDMSLNVNDTFFNINRSIFSATIDTAIYIVDSVYYNINGMKNIVLNQNLQVFDSQDYPTNNKLTFIEGVGPNVGLVFYSKNDLSYLLCHLKDDTIAYQHENSFFGQTCEFFTNNININHFDLHSNFSLFPNPTTDFIYLQLENTENVNYRIADITGKVMAQNTWNGQAISVESLNSGVYFITLLNKNVTLGTQKIIKR